jgi:hypothetical protein
MDFCKRLHEGFQSATTKIPYSAEQGIWISMQGFFSTEQGILAASAEVLGGASKPTKNNRRLIGVAGACLKANIC